ncbi:uncharacterized protein [Montipora foliosa]
MNKQIARVNWSRGKYSDVVRSTIVDPSPLKQGQRVRVIWGKGKKEYGATITCYPLIDEIEPPVDEPQLRQTKAKRKLIPEATSSAECRKKTKTDKPKPKEKPKGKVLDAASPSKINESIEDTSDDSSDGEDFPLVAYKPQRKVRDMEKPVQETPEEMPHFLESEEESDNINFGSLLSKAIRTVDHSTAIVSTDKNSGSNKHDQTVNELRLVRMILERLECSYAKQEAKLDRLLSLVTTQPFRASHCSTTGTPELPYTPTVLFRQEPAADKSDLHRTPCMTEPDRVLDELIQQTDFDSAA